MKRALFLAIFILGSSHLALSQEAITAPAPDAAGVAAREAAEERSKRVSADIEALQSANEALQAKMASMEQEIQALRDAQARAADNSGLQESLKTLAEKIQEVDKKREEDKAVISDEIRKSIGGLEKSISTPTPARASVKSNDAEADSGAAAAAGGYTYTIHDGDMLYTIVRAYNAEFKSKGLKPISSAQVRAANPDVKRWDRLRIGQKIVIPQPAGP